VLLTPAAGAAALDHLLSLWATAQGPPARRAAAPGHRSRAAGQLAAAAGGLGMPPSLAHAALELCRRLVRQPPLAQRFVAASGPSRLLSLGGGAAFFGRTYLVAATLRLSLEAAPALLRAALEAEVQTKRPAHFGRISIACRLKINKMHALAL
jgi:hypothetical protein